MLSLPLTLTLPRQQKNVLILRKQRLLLFCALIIALRTINEVYGDDPIITSTKNEKKPNNDAKTKTTRTPPNIQHAFINWKEPFKNDLTEIPFFWHIPKVAGTTIQYIYSNCLNLIAASEVGVMEGNDHDTTIRIVNLNSHITKAVNVDTSTIEGLRRAHDLGLIESGLADVIYTHLLHPSTILFDNTNNKGRLFALFRHPIDRAISMYYYLQKASWEKTYDKSLKQSSLLDYAKSDKAEHNWMVRMLVDKLMVAEVNDDDLLTAKQIIYDKCVIGLYDKLSDSIDRFESYFHWKFGSQEQKTCQEELLQHGINMNKHPAIDEKSEEYNVLYQNNLLDIQLYDYVVQLYEEQGYWFDLRAGVTC